MNLSIHSIQKTLFEGEVKSVSLPTPLGEITILENHLPIVSLVEEGEIRYILSNNKQENVKFSGGVVEVLPENKIVILTKEGGHGK